MTATKAGRARLPLRVTTYNIHRCRGLDRRVRADRIARVVTSLGADITAMQEVIGASAESAGHAAAIHEAVGGAAVLAPARTLNEHAFGNMVLSRLPILESRQFDITWRHREPRIVQRVLLDVHGVTIQVFNAHLGTSLPERRAQATLLAGILDRHHEPHVPTIVAGDFNEWLSGPVTALLRERFVPCDHPTGRRRRSYPGVLPFLHLDHLYHSEHFRLQRVALVRTRETLVASDHLPLVADLVLQA